MECSLHPNTHQLKETKLSVLRNLKLLIDLIDETEEIQYERAPRPSSGVSRRGNTISDPTCETATDVRRLGVRGARATGIEALRRIDAVLLDATKTMAGAVQRWQGEGSRDG